MASHLPACVRHRCCARTPPRVELVARSANKKTATDVSEIAKRHVESEQHHHTWYVSLADPGTAARFIVLDNGLLFVGLVVELQRLTAVWPFLPVHVGQLMVQPWLNGNRCKHVQKRSRLRAVWTAFFVSLSHPICKGSHT